MLVDKYMFTSRCNKSQLSGAIKHNGYVIVVLVRGVTLDYCCGPRVAIEVSLGISCRMARLGVSRFSGLNAIFGGGHLRLLEGICF